MVFCGVWGDLCSRLRIESVIPETWQSFVASNSVWIRQSIHAINWQNVSHTSCTFHRRMCPFFSCIHCFMHYICQLLHKMSVWAVEIMLFNPSQLWLIAEGPAYTMDSARCERARGILWIKWIYDIYFKSLLQCLFKCNWLFRQSYLCQLLKCECLPLQC